ncbi:MBL fold metallo-hydrolase [Roseovarius aestuarii]|nr:MBL fold metallo-hydrolase [Roseovarius aestuarii]
MKQLDWYKVIPMGNGITAIGEPRYHQKNWSYLLCGSARALLFDTGSFYGDITQVVSRLTDLPLTVLPSHMHYDHLGNIHRLGNIHLPDLDVLRACATNDQITPNEALFLGATESRDAPTFAVSRWLPIGARIDLGNVTYDVLHTPGHSPDSVSLWCETTQTLLAADFLYPGSLYAQVPGSSLSDYLQSAQSLAAILPPQAHILGAHGGASDFDTATPPTLSPADLSALITTLTDLRDDPPEYHDGTITREVSGRMTLLFNTASMAGFDPDH